MLRLEIPRNTAYNPMIYIPFFIVILIDKRGVREAERGGKRGDKRYEYRYEYTTAAQNEKEVQAHRPAKRGMLEEASGSTLAKRGTRKRGMRKEGCATKHPAHDTPPHTTAA